MREGEDPRIESARCWCNECGWEREFDQAKFLSHTSLERSAKSRLAAHVGNTGCDYDSTEYELHYAEIEVNT